MGMRVGTRVVIWVVDTGVIMILTKRLGDKKSWAPSLLYSESTWLLGCYYDIF